MSSDVTPIFMRMNKSSMTQRKPSGNSFSAKPEAVVCEILMSLERESKALLGPNSTLHRGMKFKSPAATTRS